MALRTFMGIAWPAFLAACLLELMVFALVDPNDLQWAGQPLGLPRMGVYTAAFFAFWAASALAGGLTALLARPPADVNGCPVPPEGRPPGCR